MKIPYTFNVGDKLKVINSLVGETIGIITNKPLTRITIPSGECISLEVIKSEAYETGDIIRVYCLNDFELLEMEGAITDIFSEKSRKSKIIIKNKMITFVDNENYIKFENGSSITSINGTGVRGSRANYYTELSDKDNIEETNIKQLICKKEFIYHKGIIVDIIGEFDKYILVTDGKTKNPFTYEEIEEYFVDYIDISKTIFKVIDNGYIGLREFYYE